MNDPFAGVLDLVDSNWATALGEQSKQDDTPKTTAFYDRLTGDGRMARWHDLAREVGTKHGVPRDVVLGLIEAESGGDPAYQAAGGRVVGLAGVPKERFLDGEQADDPGTNVNRAVSRLAALYAKTGDWTKAAVKNYGAADDDGNPAYVAPGVDGHAYAKKFEQARRRYAQGGSDAGR